MVEEKVSNLTVRCTIKADGIENKVWEVHGISTPVRYVTINFHPIEQNILQVSCNLENIKFLRLKKLITWKKINKITSICGYDNNTPEYVKLYPPRSWKGQDFKKEINQFLKILLDEAWKDI